MPFDLSSTLEDYLVTVHRLEGEKRVARPRDIGRLQNVAKSTVTAALRSLADKGLVHYEPYEAVTLTSRGRKMADRLVVRNRILRDFLEDVLGLDPPQAESTACGMEHAVEEEAMERFVCFLAFVKQHAPEGARWLSEFRRFVRRGGSSRACRESVAQYLRGLHAAQSGDLNT
jgi:DtxR family Mn-dependent transcriptional regulator